MLQPFLRSQCLGGVQGDRNRPILAPGDPLPVPS